MTSSTPIPERVPAARAEFRVLLVGNYPHDRQESMLRFANVLLDSLRQRGIDAVLLSPQPFFGLLKAGSSGLGKWLGYLDKFVLFPLQLKRAVRQARADKPPLPVVVHICDHSNAFYSRHLQNVSCAITCHDLLAIRGALGEPTDCPASATGRILQRWILNGLAGATTLVCDSTATQQDVVRLVKNGGEKARLVLLGLNHHFTVLPPSEILARLASVPKLPDTYLLHVGSNLRRKNREGVLRIFQKISARWSGGLVLAGPSITPELWQLARELGIEDRVTEVVQPDDDVLEALYNRAAALLFPSRFEGFGWPIIEAQACGCPVVCSASGPLPEVVGEGGLVCEVEDEEGLADAVLQVTQPDQRVAYVRKGLANVQRFTTQRMINDYVEVYSELSRR